ncbi:unnamed protein product [Phaeothamnion confervicola]
MARAVERCLKLVSEASSELPGGPCFRTYKPLLEELIARRDVAGAARVCEHMRLNNAPMRADFSAGLVDLFGGGAGGDGMPRGDTKGGDRWRQRNVDGESGDVSGEGGIVSGGADAVAGGNSSDSTETSSAAGGGGGNSSGAAVVAERSGGGPVHAEALAALLDDMAQLDIEPVPAFIDTLAARGLAVRAQAVDKNVCSACGGALLPSPLLPAERAQVRAALMEQVGQQSKGAALALEAFGAHLQTMERPPTVIVDGPNVAYHKQNLAHGTFSFPALVAIVAELERRGETVLVIMPRRFGLGGHFLLPPRRLRGAYAVRVAEGAKAAAAAAAAASATRDVVAALKSAAGGSSNSTSSSSGDDSDERLANNGGGGSSAGSRSGESFLREMVGAGSTPVFKGSSGALYIRQRQPGTEVQVMMREWERQGKIFAVPDAFHDDWFWMYGTVAIDDGPGSLALSNDQVRNHGLSERLKPSLLARWRSTHLARFHFETPWERLERPEKEFRPQLLWPEPLAMRVQGARWHWHVPVPLPEASPAGASASGGVAAMADAGGNAEGGDENDGKEDDVGNDGGGGGRDDFPATDGAGAGAASDAPQAVREWMCVNLPPSTMPAVAAGPPLPMSAAALRRCTNAELRLELVRRRLDAKGKKEKLVQRLMQSMCKG